MVPTLSFLSVLAVPLSIDVDACGEDGLSPSGVLLQRRQTTSKTWGGVSVTRQEFIDGVTTWTELIEFCRANDLNACDDIIQHNAL